MCFDVQEDAMAKRNFVREEVKTVIVLYKGPYYLHEIFPTVNMP